LSEPAETAPAAALAAAPLDKDGANDLVAGVPPSFATRTMRVSVVQ